MAGRRVRRRATCSSSPARRSRSSRSWCRSLFVRDTAAHVALEQAAHDPATTPPPPLRDAFPDATWRAPALRACSQAGLVNNLNDALAWGLVPLFLAAHGASVGADRPRRRAVPGGLGRRPDLDRPLVRPRRSQAADRRRHAAAGRRAAAARRLRRRGRARRAWPRCCSAPAPRSSTRRSSPRSPTPSHRSRARRWSASTASGATWATSPAALIAGIVADALGFGGAIGVVAALTAPPGSGSRSTCRDRPRREAAPRLRLMRRDCGGLHDACPAAPPASNGRSHRTSKEGLQPTCQYRRKPASPGNRCPIVASPSDGPSLLIGRSRLRAPRRNPRKRRERAAAAGGVDQAARGRGAARLAR